MEICLGTAAFSSHLDVVEEKSDEKSEEKSGAGI